jgi:hypothetical protein
VIELTKAAIAQRRWEDAQALLEQVKSFPSGYDFERMAGLTIKKLASQIAKQEPPPE